MGDLRGTSATSPGSWRHDNGGAGKCKPEVLAKDAGAIGVNVGKVPVVKTEISTRVLAEALAGPADVSAVIPCLNEANSIGVCVEKAMQAFRAAGVRGEVVVADNGSTDGSVEIAEKLGARVIHVPKRGYGMALRYGIEAARSRFVIMGDADDSYDFTALDDFVSRLREGFDLVMGNRFRGRI